MSTPENIAEMVVKIASDVANVVSDEMISVITESKNDSVEPMEPAEPVAEPVVPIEPVAEPVVLTEPVAEPVVPVNVYFNELLKELEQISKDKEVNSINILSICINLMQITERYPKLKGREKKELVLKVLNKYFEDHKLDQELLKLVPSFIDASVSLDRGEISIKVSTEEVAGCCANILSILLENRKKKK